MIVRRIVSCFVFVLIVGILAGCGGTTPDSSSSSSTAQTDGASPAPEAGSESSSLVENLHRQLEAENPSYNGQGKFNLQNGEVVAAVLRNTGVQDLSPLEGLSLRGIDLYGNPVSNLRPLEDMPLEAVYLEETDVRDLSPLQGMSLQVIYLSNTLVEDLSPLQGMPLQELNLLGTSVTDLSPIKEAPLRMVWLNDTPIEDIQPLENSPVMSLTLKGTQVSDLSSIPEMSNLQRLHIAETPITDLRPLEGMRLTRLVFTPSNIQSGLSVVREMNSLQEIGTTFTTESRELMTPDQFWEKFDAGAFQTDG